MRIDLRIFLLFIVQMILIQKGYAGVEYVYIKKTIDDYAIIVRKDGNTYLIEKGIGCLSLWRFEGEVVLIKSPGIFLGLGSELLIPDVNQECRIRNSEYLGSESSCTKEHWIKSKSNDGAIIILEDESVWEVNIVDRIHSILWIPTENVIVCNGKMVNLNNGNKINVIRLK